VNCLFEMNRCWLLEVVRKFDHSVGDVWPCADREMLKRANKLLICLNISRFVYIFADTLDWNIVIQGCLFWIRICEIKAINEVIDFCAVD